MRLVLFDDMVDGRAGACAIWCGLIGLVGGESDTQVLSSLFDIMLVVVVLYCTKAWIESKIR